MEVGAIQLSGLPGMHLPAALCKAQRASTATSLLTLCRVYVKINSLILSFYNSK